MRYVALCLLALLCGCAGGPPHDYYSPAVVDGPRFKGAITMEVVDDIEAAKSRYLSDSCILLGTSNYTGDQPKANELKAQARRAHANRVVYSLKDVSRPGSWHFNFGGFGSGGGSDHTYETRILYF